MYEAENWYRWVLGGGGSEFRTPNIVRPAHHPLQDHGEGQNLKNTLQHCRKLTIGISGFWGVADSNFVLSISPDLPITHYKTMVTAKILKIHYNNVGS